MRLREIKKSEIYVLKNIIINKNNTRTKLRIPNYWRVSLFNDFFQSAALQAQEGPKTLSVFCVRYSSMKKVSF